MICPACKVTIVLNDQQDRGKLTKKKMHQLYVSDLAWRKLLSIKGGKFKNMEELVRYLASLHDLALTMSMDGIDPSSINAIAAGLSTHTLMEPPHPNLPVPPTTPAGSHPTKRFATFDKQAKK